MANNSAEYYFEYKIRKISGDGAIETPRFYFERDYRTDGVPYVLFVVFDEWSKRKDKKEVNDSLFDKIHYVYDISGTQCTPLLDRKSGAYEKAEKKGDVLPLQYIEAGRRLNITSNFFREDHSGVGILELSKDGRVVAQFYFAVNFTFKKRILYTLERTNDKLSLKFTCASAPQNLLVQVVYAQGRLPCLKSEMNQNTVTRSGISLNFGGKKTYKTTVGLESSAREKGNVFSVSFFNEEMSKYFLLVCEKNDTYKIPKPSEEFAQISYSCPYCHTPIGYGLKRDPQYARGGISCAGALGAPAPVLFDSSDKPPKNCMYCNDDLNKSDKAKFVFKPDFERLLPANFMGHNNFKVLFMGSSRAGKTTYISRLFDLDRHNAEAVMRMNMITRCLDKFHIKVNPADVSTFTRSGDRYTVTGEQWMNHNNQYIQRAISMESDHYPEITVSRQAYDKYPFIAEFNQKAYVSFYDIAGEDSQERPAQINKVAGSDLVGVFCLINGQANSARNDDVIHALIRSDLKKDCPIAVIVTKMDILEPQFDPNCMCLSSDYFESGKTYRGSELERMIDISSLEIESFLKQHRLYPAFRDEDGKSDRFTNVKFFGVSSFNFPESIHEETENIDDPGRLKFSCSANHIDLPLLWMLKQFGVIH